MQSKNVIIFDLDGTISCPEHRLHYVRQKKKNFDAFYAEVSKDKPKQDIIKILQCLKYFQKDTEIWIVTGRSDIVKQQTIDWLKEHNIPYNNLVMRKHGDYTHDADLKRSWLYNGMLPDKESIWCCFDDRQRVVDMWREEGLTCLQVDQWNEIDFGKNFENPLSK